jgi:2-polyprenyl-6-methoxyphenol hydroxylase-like FAD-dependent oxidoreductase
MARRRALVIGGGVAGLAVAISLARRGASVTVAEREVGWSVADWGLCLPGRALRALATLGLVDACLWCGYGATQIAHCDPTGVVQDRVELPRTLGPDRPALVGLGRATLHQILRGEAERCGALLRDGLTATRIAQTPDGVGVHLSDGSTSHVDLVVGADGLSSTVKTLVGIDDQPGYTGQVAWRATVPRPDWATGPHTFAGAPHDAGLVPISPRHAFVYLTERDADPAAVPKDRLADRMRALMTGFAGRAAEARDAIGDSATVTRHPVRAGLVDRPWHRGRVVLVGDAAHALPPGLDVGAALAFEDAIVLADELAQHDLARPDDEESALEAFGARRLDRCRAAVETA